MNKHVIEMPGEAYYAMNRLCEWTINGNVYGVYRDRNQPALDAMAIERWMNGNSFCVLPPPLSDDPAMDEVPFAPR